MSAVREFAAYFIGRHLIDVLGVGSGRLIILG